MDALKAIKEQKKTVEESFKTFSQRKVELERQLSEVNAELVRLQGAFRTIGDLEKELSEKPKKK